MAKTASFTAIVILLIQCSGECGREALFCKIDNFDIVSQGPLSDFNAIRCKNAFAGLRTLLINDNVVAAGGLAGQMTRLEKAGRDEPLVEAYALIVAHRGSIR